MRKLFALFFALLALVIAIPAVTLNPDVPVSYSYAVKEGDTLWKLSGTQWERVVEANPWLEGRVERKSADLVIVRIYPGEEIFIPAGYGIENTLDAGNTASEGAQKPKVAAADNSNRSTTSMGQNSFPLWLSLLLGALALGSLYAIYRGLRIMRNPVTSGEPFLPGGISPDQPGEIEMCFREIAQRRSQELNPLARLTEPPVRVSPIEEGTLSGVGRVRYGNGAQERRVLRREPAFRARFRFPNGIEEELYFLQGCANDVTAGTRYLGFTFESRRVVVPPPAPPEPERRQAAIHLVDPSHPEVQPAPTRIVVGAAELTIPSGGIITVNEKGLVYVNVGGITLSARAYRPKTARKPASTAAADSTQ